MEESLESEEQHSQRKHRLVSLDGWKGQRENALTLGMYLTPSLWLNWIACRHYLAYFDSQTCAN
jgi:hypothetical protein